MLSGYIDRTGAWVIPPQFHEAWEFSEGRGLVRNEFGRFGFIDPSGRLVIPYRYHYATSFSFGRSAVIEDHPRFHQSNIPLRQWYAALKPYRYIDRDGKTVIDMPLLRAEPFQEGFAVVETDPNREGFVDPGGNLTLVDGSPLWFAEGLCRFQRDGRWGYMNSDGDDAIPPTYEDADDFSEGIACVWEKAYPEQEFIDRHGETVFMWSTPTKGYFSEGRLGVRIEGKWGFVGRDGDVVLPPRWDDVGDAFQQSRIPAKEGDLWGYIDPFGCWICEPQFTHADAFSEDLAAVCINDKWGYIRLDGSWAITPRFASRSRFREGLAAVGSPASSSSSDQGLHEEPRDAPCLHRSDRPLSRMDLNIIPN